MGILITIISIVQTISALGLIVLVMSQTTKSEGLSGTIGGKMSSSFRGKPGMDDKLADLTKYSAILFMVLSLLLYILKSKMAV